MRTRDAVRRARKDGANAGAVAASWVFDGNTKDETYRRVLEGIEDGDPEMLDSFNVPNLSGEWAGDPTPQSLAEGYGVDYEADGNEWRLDAICSAWEEGAAEAFMREVARLAREGER